ncbi:SNF2 family N-terminal domain [Geosmithia morbida]|uniref:SNF2 family N-terminal domain n=1 Tax=Geosmithia morbida TaxID=1094350 RepID=A0A9P4YX43_9HYPO|nr:SNF2 family N-terminal domain [Geosmithia morbida]KAF4123412.1 SNF2 family N-terminal domain [Geosmithia morbida]
MAPFHDRYIAAGSFCISREKSDLSSEIWDSEDLFSWHTLGSPAGDQEDGHHVPDGIQSLLFKSPTLNSYTRLLKAEWIRLALKIDRNATYATFRVYILPDELHGELIDLSYPSLRKASRAILAQLDYSAAAWEGRLRGTANSHGPHPLEYQTTSYGERDMSLLELFNNIPSPKPDPISVADPLPRDAMDNLLKSEVPGLETSLYDYQRRTSALMVQKEAQPGRTLDPRLRKLRDQVGKEWYWDRISGTILGEPRYYDGISGGILAEEMGSGKTIICLALILASRSAPTKIPEIYGPPPPPVRPRIGSLVDMAASCVSRNAIPWRDDLEASGMECCINAIRGQPGYYFVPPPKLRRTSRHVDNGEHDHRLPIKVHLSQATLIVVPNNLVSQWRQEIQKHTSGTEVVVVTSKDPLPATEALLECDIVLFSQSRFETLVAQASFSQPKPFENLHFKRCIVDEGHKIGNSSAKRRSRLLTGLDLLRADSRWVVTGTPSYGLFGVDPSKSRSKDHSLPEDSTIPDPPTPGEADVCGSSSEMERKDLERIGSMASLFLGVRPWANTELDADDARADWNTYMMLPRHKRGSNGRWDILMATLDSLIVRHQLSDIGDLLPRVDERIVVLGGSYQDRLSMGIFSMMIIFNSVQSQRTDKDYFFHPRQRRNLLQLVQNLKQSTFFGGSFFTSSEIATSVETAEQFLSEKRIPLSAEDEDLLNQAIKLGHVAVGNEMRNLSNKFHEMPIYVKDFPSKAGKSWSLGGGTTTEPSGSSNTTTLASLILALQRLVHNAAGEPEKLNALLNGGLAQKGEREREMLQQTVTPAKTAETLAGNTKLGGDSPRKTRSRGINLDKPMDNASLGVAGPLESTRITATVSAKMSYLLDQVAKYQAEEKIIIFYENENVAWYLASMLDVLQIQHLIYAKSISVERRTQYVNTFHHNATFRVLLMDLSQAAFGLDMREASRIYFINPVLNPQVEAQAIGRARRVCSQKGVVSVETLVLRDSIDEVILERKRKMTAAEHRRAKTILDIRPIFDWIKNPTIETGLLATAATAASDQDDVAQMASLDGAHHVFGAGFGRALHPDDGLVLDSLSSSSSRDNNREGERVVSGFGGEGSAKRSWDDGPGHRGQQDPARPPTRKVRFG